MKGLFEERIKENLWRYYFVQLGLTDWERRSEKRIKEDLTSVPERIKKLEQYIGKIRDKRTLSVGSGWGGFVVAASKAGADAVGVEPDAEEIAIHSKIKVRVEDELYETTTGRIMLWETIPGDTLLSLVRFCRPRDHFQVFCSPAKSPPLASGTQPEPQTLLTSGLR